LFDRSSAPRRVANRTPADRVGVIVALRQLRMTAAEIAETLAMPLSTVSAILSRAGIGRLGRIGLEQPVRYERSRPGELVHIDVKKLGRIEGGAGKRVAGRTPGSYRPRRRDASGSRRGLIGWEFVHVAVDDYSRLAYAEVPPRRAGDHRGRLSPAGARLLSPSRDQGRACSHRQRQRLRRNDPRARLPQASRRPPPHPTASPQTNGKAERFIRTLVDGWAYGAIYRSSSERTAALDGWLWHYN
jgi:hypothetical protein